MAELYLPLRGIRVLDLTRLLPGPYATYILAGYGADVIKVEDTGAGDYARHSPPLACSGLGAAFTASNAGKRSVAIDLKHPEGRAAFLQLLDTADVLVESFRPGAMRRLELDYDALRARRPGLVYCAVTGYGQKTRQAALAGHDLNYQGEAGLLAQRPAGSDALPSALLGDLVGGAYAAVIAILAAVLEQRASGQGRFIDISIAHGAMALLPFNNVAAANGETAQAFGESTLTGGNPFYGLYATADGRYVSLGALEPKFWRSFCRHAGLDDLADPSQVPDHPDGATRQRIRHRLQALFRTRTAAEWSTLGGQWDVCLGAVATAEEAWEAAHAQGLPMAHHYQRAGGTRVQVPKAMSADLAEPVRELSAPPAQGEHTRTLLAEAGCTAEQLASWQDRGIIQAM